MKKKFWLITVVFAAVALLFACGDPGSGQQNLPEPPPVEMPFTIISPYAGVNWDTFGRYKASLHNHTRYGSDGQATLAAHLEDLYSRGFDIVAITDHNLVTRDWVSRREGGLHNGFNPDLDVPLTPERFAQMDTGSDRDGRRMLMIPDSNEQSFHQHVNTFMANFNNAQVNTLANQRATIEAVHNMGGLSHLNHLGRYTGGQDGGQAGINASNNTTHINRIVALFEDFSSLVGMEIINARDHESRSDRILWDNILRELMPDRPVWGFANDDAHSLFDNGNSFNRFIMPSNTLENFRDAMIGGNFYAVARVARREMGLPTENPPHGWNAPTDRDAPTPSITRIATDETRGTITITAANYTRIDWIGGLSSDVIFTGNTIYLGSHADKIGTYVRANIIGPNGVAFTQPFGIEDPNFVAPTPHTITIDPAITNGTVTTNYQSSLPNRVITITATPNQGWGVQNVTVTQQGGTAVNVEGTGVTRTFTMPNAPVTVSATFRYLDLPPGFIDDFERGGPVDRHTGSGEPQMAGGAGYVQRGFFIQTNSGSFTTLEAGFCTDHFVSGTQSFRIDFATPSGGRNFRAGYDSYNVATAGFDTLVFDFKVSLPGTYQVRMQNQPGGTEFARTLNITVANQWQEIRVLFNEFNNGGFSGDTVTSVYFFFNNADFTGHPISGSIWVDNVRLETAPVLGDITLDVSSESNPVTEDQEFTLDVGTTRTFTVTATPANAALAWATSNANIASLSAASGSPVTVTAGTQVGTATITITASAEDYHNEVFTFRVTTRDPAAQEFNITVDSPIANGEVSVNPDRAVQTQTVTITATPDSGYRLVTDSITVTKDGGGTVPVIITGTVGGVVTTTFEMPDDNVTVTAAFEEIPTATDYLIDSFEGAPSLVAGVVRQNISITAAGYQQIGFFLYSASGTINPQFSFDTTQSTHGTQSLLLSFTQGNTGARTLRAGYDRYNVSTAGFDTLVFDVRLSHPSSVIARVPLQIRMQSAPGGTEFNHPFTVDNADQWVTIEAPFSSFSGGGFTASTITSIYLYMENPDVLSGSIWIDNIRLR